MMLLELRKFDKKTVVQKDPFIDDCTTKDKKESVETFLCETSKRLRNDVEK